MLVLTGCPVSSKYPLGEKGKEEFNEMLIGTWFNDQSESTAKQVTITSGEELNTAKLHVDEKGESFMADDVNFLIWQTILEKKTFLVLQQILDGQPVETFYVHHISIADNKVTTSDIGLLVNGSDAITSIESYREEVKASMDNSAFLSEQIVWMKK